MVSCDTSFLASLYLLDTHTPKARAKLRQIRPPEELMLSPFHQYELPNAVRLGVFRGLRDAAAGETILAAFEADLASGYFALPTSASDLSLTKNVQQVGWRIATPRVGSPLLLTLPITLPKI
jgi:hypothetical protein